MRGKAKADLKSIKKVKFMDSIIIEEKLSHIMKSLDELSDIVAKHETTITLSTSRIEKLMNMLAEKELESGGAAYFQDDKPPHY
jgi:SlyX protein|tara:strand:+ start:1838 stop:2089 length:252 start_codon:yes stop_codon:yes gene_type:complete